MPGISRAVRKETLSQMTLNECWLNTDKMTNHLNNVRKKGHGRKSVAERAEESKFPTNVIISSDMNSRYVLRADIAYDWNIKFYKWANNPFTHPLASKDTGFHTVDCRTDVTSYSTKDLAEILLDLNHNATDAFMQLIRRRVSLLERPLVTARGDGKSYIYANFNPKYAKYALTILRVYFKHALL